MAGGMKSLDLMFMARELRDALLGGKFRRIYQHGQGQNRFLFEIYAPSKKNLRLYADSDRIFLTKHKGEAPKTPPNFCMLLRKHLTGKTIRDIRQHGFDRIVEIATDGCVLVFEFVPPGNVVLCDSSSNIIMPLHARRWKDREILPKKQYAYPPEKPDPYSIALEDFEKTIKNDEGDAITAIARLGFGPGYADEICSLAGVNPEKPAGSVSQEELSAVFRIIKETGNKEIEPVSYEGGAVSPFPLKSRKEAIAKKWPSFSSPLDEVHSGRVAEEAARERTKESGEKKEKLGRIVRRQEEIKEKLKERSAENREKADAINANYALVDKVLKGISGAKGSGLSWTDIKLRIMNNPSPEARAVAEIREHEGIIVMNLGGKNVELDFRKSAGENAAACYDGSRSAREKLARAGRAMKTKMDEMESMEDVSAKEKAPPSGKQAMTRKKWYESFRWFISSGGFLIVAGKDADTNEDLVKRHTEEGDMIFHSDIQGSAFVVMKAKPPEGGRFAGLAQGREFPEDAKREASQVAAALSKAWSRGLGSVDVYAVRPSQLSKAPPSGMSLPKGSFMVYGQREWFRGTPVKISIGVVIDAAQGRTEVMSGPEAAIRSLARQPISIQPGEIQAKELAREIKSILLNKSSLEDRPLIAKISLDDIQKLIPSGKGQIAG